MTPCWLSVRSTGGAVSTHHTRLERWQGGTLYHRLRVPHPKHNPAMRSSRRHTAAVSLQKAQKAQSTEGSSSLARPNWSLYLGSMAAWGAVSGTLLDGIHSRVQLQIYDVAPLSLGPLHTSALVPPLLAVFYVVMAALHYYSDELLQGDESTQAALQRSKGAGFVALCAGVLALQLYLSAALFQAEVAPERIFLVLGAVALVNWRLLDNTWQGLVLAVVCSLGAPAAELVLNYYFHLWHYPRADLFDGAFVSWVPWCYFFYIPALGNLSRHMWQLTQQQTNAAGREL